MASSKRAARGTRVAGLGVSELRDIISMCRQEGVSHLCLPGGFSVTISTTALPPSPPLLAGSLSRANEGVSDDSDDDSEARLEHLRITDPVEYERIITSSEE
jgi:hypothetical protein